jgi:uncharacterized membrane protein YfcA
MHDWHFILLVFTSFCAGVINAVAGGGSLLTYPLLVSGGISPIIANASVSAINWPGAVSSAIGYRKHIKKLPWYYYLLLIPSLAGGLIGAIILRKTPGADFKHIVPWFFLLAVGLILFQPNIKRWLTRQKGKKNKTNYRKIIGLVIALLIIIAASIYGGYFGAGFGVIMLAMLGFTTLTDIQEMNGLKNISAACINLSAIIYFSIYHLIDWRLIPLLLVANLIGGWVGSHYSSKLPSHAIRGLIIIVGTALAILLFIRPNL